MVESYSLRGSTSRGSRERHSGDMLCVHGVSKHGDGGPLSGSGLQLVLCTCLQS